MRMTECINLKDPKMGNSTANEEDSYARTCGLFLAGKLLQSLSKNNNFFPERSVAGNFIEPFKP